MIGAVDIGGTKIAVGAVMEDGTILEKCESPTDPEAGFPAAIERIKQMLRKVQPAGRDYIGIGIACPGPLDPLTGIIGDVGTLPTWQGGNLCEMIAAEFGVSVAVENDADAGALAEARWGIAKGAQSYIYVTVSTGIGGGVMLAGRLYRGVDGAHPEFGHHLIDPSGPLCYCNLHGCWESLASGEALVAWMHEQYPETRAKTAEEICELARLGDPSALHALQREAHYLGLGLANLVTLFTPDLISLGGGLMKSSPLFFNSALQVVRKSCTQVPAHKTRIVLASLGSETGLLGAASAWLHRNTSS